VLCLKVRDYGVHKCKSVMDINILCHFSMWHDPFLPAQDIVQKEDQPCEHLEPVACQCCRCMCPHLPRSVPVQLVDGWSLWQQWRR
jgi:hypothetical protein